MSIFLRSFLLALCLFLAPGVYAQNSIDYRRPPTCQEAVEMMLAGQLEIDELVTRFRADDITYSEGNVVAVKLNALLTMVEFLEHYYNKTCQEAGRSDVPLKGERYVGNLDQS